MDIVTLLLLGVFPCLAIVAGIHDLTSMKIPNWISGLLVLSFLPAAFAVGLPLSAIAIHAGVALFALLAGMAMFALRWLGGGDAKLMASACLWLGLTGSGMFVLWTGVMGGVLCLALLFARSHMGAYLTTVGPGWVGPLMEPKGDIPYGVAIAAGALMAFPASPLLATFAAG